MRILLPVLIASLACSHDRKRQAPVTIQDTELTPVVEPQPFDSAAVFPYGHPLPEAHLREDRLAILGVRLDMPDSMVRRLLGSPGDSTPAHVEDMIDDSVVVWRYPGIEVSFAGHTVYDLQCVASRCETADGIRIGTTREAVTQVYGPGFRGYSRAHDVLIYYPQTLDCSMSFDFSNDRVYRMALQCDFS